MALTEEEKGDIADVVRKAMADGCLCGHQEHVEHLFDRFKALGEGNIEKGIESFAKSIIVINKVRHWKMGKWGRP